MRYNTLMMLALTLVTVAPATAQSTAERRAQEQRQRAAELRAALETRGALEAQAAQMDETRLELEAVLEAAKARQAEGADLRLVELETALQAAKAQRADIGEARLAEVELALEMARSKQAAMADHQRQELEVALQAAQAQRGQLEERERAAREQAREIARVDRTRDLERQRLEMEVALRAARSEQAREADRLRELREVERADRSNEREARMALESALRAERDLETTAMERQREALAAAVRAGPEAGALLDRLGGAGPPEAWAPQDPADSLWRQARARLNGGDHAAAVRMFRRIRTEPLFANSEYRPDAFYWEAFALVRTGGPDALKEAQQVLEELEKAYPPARRSPDAAALAARLDAGLAGQGYAEEYDAATARLRDLARTYTVDHPAYQAARAEAEALQRYTEARALGDASAATYQSQLQKAEQYRAAEAYAGALESTGYRGQNLALAAQASRQCQNDEEEIRLIALNALVEMDDTAAIPALREVLARRDECAFQFRRQAMMILSRRDSPGTEVIALGVAREDPDPQVRLMALTWLIENESGEAFDIAQSILDSSSEPETRRAAIMALARSRNERARQILRDFVSSEAPVDQRAEALMALPLARGSGDALFLKQVYGETDDRRMKEYALIALGRRALEGEAAWLLGVAQDEAEDAELRVQALHMLRSETEVSVGSIESIYDQSDNRRLREAALMMLTERSRSDQAALAKVIQLAHEEEDVDLRRQAVMTLIRSKDPKAQAAVLEILRKK